MAHKQYHSERRAPARNPKAELVPFLTRFTTKTKEHLDEYAEQSERSKAWIIERAVVLYLEQEAHLDTRIDRMTAGAHA